MIKLGIVGTGFMGRTHLESFSKLDSVGGIYLLTKISEQGEALRAKHEKVVSVTTDDEDFFSNDLDAVDICTPTPSHASLVRRAIQARCHVLCEKPLCLDHAEASRLVEEAEAAGLSFMVAHVIRFWPEYKYLQEAIRSAALGDIRSLRLERYSTLPAWGDWFSDLSASGGALYDLHIHDVDYMAQVLGLPLRVSSTGRKADGVAYLDVESCFVHRDQVRASVYGSYDHPPSTPIRMQYRALFERGCLDYDLWREDKLVEFAEGGRRVITITDERSGYDEECAYFAECLSKGVRPSLSSAASSTETLRLLGLIGQSADQDGAWIEVSPIVNQGDHS